MSNSLSIKEISDYFKSQGYLVTHHRDVLHVILSTDHSSSFFVFKNGCFVTWGLKKQTEANLIKKIKEYAIDPLETPEIDHFVYIVGNKTKISSHRKFSVDIITINEEEDDNVQIKLAIAYGLAQSVKLQMYEESIQKTVENNKKIPNTLSKKGYIPLSRKAISKRIGEIFMERSQVNISGGYFEVPEYFWDYAGLERYYVMTEQFLDIPQRVTVLNRKLDVLHDLFDVLNNQLQHRYSSMLEYIIIFLISIEIIINTLQVLVKH